MVWTYYKVSPDHPCFKNVRDLLQYHLPQMHKWENQRSDPDARGLMCCPKTKTILHASSFIYEPPNTFIIFHACIIILSYYIEPKKIIIKLSYLSFREQYTRMILEQENLGKVRMRFLPCNNIVQFIFLWGLFPKAVVSLL